MTQPELDYYEASFVDLRERLIRVLGSATVNRLVERSVVEIRGAHPGIEGLRCEDDEVVFQDVREALSDASAEEVRDSFTALNGVLMVLVARLLGREIADRLTEGITKLSYLEGRGDL
jgi:hypothetical protein